MSDLQRAIDFVEELRISYLETSSIKLPNPDWLYSLAKHDDRRNMFDTALSALREKQQREAGCEWCTKLTNLSYSDASYYDDIRACVGMQKDIHILERHKKDDYVLNISSHAGNWIDYPIHYCPMCGRQLSGNTEQGEAGNEQAGSVRIP